VEVRENLPACHNGSPPANVDDHQRRHGWIRPLIAITIRQIELNGMLRSVNTKSKKSTCHALPTREGEGAIEGSLWGLFQAEAARLNLP